MSNFTVFYSWQSDLMAATNRTLIEDALALAAKVIVQDDSLAVEPVIDRDTLGRPGSPSIDEAIFAKIEAAQVHVADISIVNQAAISLAKTHPERPGELALRPTPNPNVLLELGYAVKTHDWDNVILVFNRATGDPRTDLPFDLRQKRRLEYTSLPEDGDRQAARKALAKGLETALREIIAHQARQPVVPTSLSLFERAVEGITTHAPDRQGRVRAFNRWFIDELDTANPGENAPAEFVESLHAGRHLMAQYSMVAEAAALAEDPTCIRELWRGLELALNKYDVPAGFSGRIDDQPHDWWKFHGYEMCVILTAHLLCERKLALIGELADTVFIQRRWLETRNSRRCDYRDLSMYVKRVYAWNEGLPQMGKNKWLSPAGELRKMFYAGGPPNLPEWSLFCEADFLLALVGISGRLPKNGEAWHNVTHLYMSRSPRFLVEAASMPYFNELRLLLIKLDVHGLRTFINERWEGMTKMWDRTFERHTPDEGSSTLSGQDSMSRIRVTIHS